MNIVTTVYEQQRILFESGMYSIPRRIVSLVQPWVWPIVRGKAHANTEFGPKLHISLVDGYARIERPDFEPFNESEDLWRWPDIGGAMDIILNAFWRIRSTATARRWLFARSMGSGCPAPPWTSLPKIWFDPVRLRNRSIRTTATATQWGIFSEQARPLMAWAV